MRILFLFIILLLHTSSYAQDTLVVEYKLVDKKTDDPIPNGQATITVNGGKTIFKSSNQKGIIRFYCFEGDKVESNITHSVYSTIQKSFKAESSMDTIRFELPMVSDRMLYVPEMIVKPVGEPYEVFGSKRLSVADFEIKPDGRLILLTYPKRLSKGSELLLTEGQNIINSFQVPGVAEELVRDFRGNPHIVCEENVYGIYASENGVGIGELPRDYFLKYILPIIDTNKTKMYFSNFDENYPAMDYFAFDQLDSTYTKIMNIEDDLMMELYRSEYKWMDVRTKLWAYNQELMTGIDKEIWVGANYFTNSIYYEEIYAPLFHRNDSLFVFDYYKDQLYTYDYKGELLDSVGIYHHYQPRATGWQKKLIQDQITGEIYALYDKHGYSYIGRIDVKTGEIGELVRLKYRYMEKLAIYNNSAYYIYRPFESVQKKYLYQEKLPYQFGKAKVDQRNDTSINTGK